MVSRTIITIVVSILLLLAGVIFWYFFIRKETTPIVYTCSISLPNGTCPSGETCTNGECKPSPVVYTCSQLVSHGTCPPGETCTNGECKPSPTPPTPPSPVVYTCSISLPNGTCPEGQSCLNGGCQVPNCTNGGITCEPGQVCVNTICQQKIPKRTNVRDCGFGNKIRGYYDVKGIGQQVDFCRYVGEVNNPYFSCAVAGESSEYTASNDPRVLKIDPNTPHIETAKGEPACIK